MSWYLIQLAEIVLVSSEASIKKILYDTIEDSDYRSGVFSYLYALFNNLLSYKTLCTNNSCK